MRINFYLKKRTGLISMRYRHQGIVFQFSTSINIEPGYWDGRRIKNLKGVVDATENNLYLDKCENSIRKAHSILTSRGELTKSNL